MSRITQEQIRKFAENRDGSINDKHGCWYNTAHSACLYPDTVFFNTQMQDQKDSPMARLVLNDQWEYLGNIESKATNKKINEVKKENKKMSMVIISKTLYDVRLIQWFLRKYQRMNDTIEVWGLATKAGKYDSAKQNPDLHNDVAIKWRENGPVALRFRGEWIYLVAPRVEESFTNAEPPKNSLVILPPFDNHASKTFFDIEEIPDEEKEIIEDVVDDIVEFVAQAPVYNPVTGEFE